MEQNHLSSFSSTNLHLLSLSLSLSVCVRGVEVIRSQISEREQQRLLDLEKKDQETASMLRYLEKLREEDMEQLQRKRGTQRNLMEEVTKCNDVSPLYLSLHYNCVASENLTVLNAVSTSH